ncbi:MAG: iron-sulfur cluster assembly protein [Ancalomicrobiaceae bacterium]|nr:iron-sulfur cluster assembly protein [Ancalomicrobiaceae bacterium]
MTDPASVSAAARIALKSVDDPELGVNIVDLGLVSRFELAEGRIDVELMMTSPTCPLGQLMSEAATVAIERAVGPGWTVTVGLDRATRWTPDLAIPEVRQRFQPKPTPRLFAFASHMLGW